MTVLQKTVDYLLQLLDQPYNDDFLGIYNFLWDRMRAIRMDLRMQHIFNREAIIMLEQMIRLHIIVMHELCEYKNGEGFSEGFDAHLNIEQMNKTLVELFQMYDDHRKTGNGVQTEKEFRGYYALLKLDKHPGYMVEPAELSHDLAKMTPEIRCTPEILFARDVARACRIGNYIAFFRLARKATYLQACLMHAHFAKVRRQALASLHCGLQNNQGIPISHVVKWLGMEEENIESLLEYHGFAVRKFEELYMVKENPFLNMDSDFPTMCSQLVHQKKSRKIIDDVYSGQTLSEVAVEKEILYDMDGQRIHNSKMETSVNTVEDAMLDHKVDSVEDATAIQLVERPSPHIMNRENNDAITEGSFSVPHYVSVDDSLSIYAQHVDDGQVSESDGDDFIDGRTLPKLEASIIQAAVPGGSNFSCMTQNFEPEAILGRNLDDEELVVEPNEDEAHIEKLKMILRKWKQRSSMLRETREQKKFLANAALNSLSLGPPIQQNKAHPRHTSEELNIDYVAQERDERREKMWSGLNVSELVAPVLSARNSDARCICWKLVIFVQVNGTETNQLASRWLLSKLKGKGGDDGLIVSLPHLSVWKKCISFHNNDPQICCLSVIREAMFNNNDPILEDDIIAGTSCIMFVVSETIPWETQQVRLHNLLMAVPCGSRLPLLVVSTDTCKEEIIDPSVTIISRLGLHNVDRTRINNFSVVFLADDSSVGQLCGFFNDIHLRNGLQWMANHAPLQPAVHVVKTRDLVLNYLRYCTEVLDNLKISEVSPDHCISAFNVALDRSAGEIITAASVNQNYWPCPEITLLEDSSNERKLPDVSLPSIGWSSDARIEPLVRAIKACKLPSFPSKMLWPSGGFSVGGQIQSQQLAMEDCLASYLLQSCQLLNVDLAAREASVMLQKVAVLELHDSCFRIIPRWLPIFWRIYNWQLTKLNSEELSEAYVLNQLDGPVGMELTSRNDAVIPVKMDTGTKDLKSSFGLERHRSLHSFQTVLSLDEMVEVSCSFSLASQQPPSVLGPVHMAPKIVHEDGHVSDIDDGRKGTDEDHRCRSNSAGDVSPPVERNKEILVAPLEKDDRLAVLLEQCNQLQDKIDEKLSVYF